MILIIKDWKVPKWYWTLKLLDYNENGVINLNELVKYKMS